VKSDPEQWDRSKWLSVIGAAVSLHLLGAWVFAARLPVPALSEVGPTPRLGWSPAAPDLLSGFAAQPTLLALPDRSGFAAEAARALPKVDYEISGRRDVPGFLGAGPDGSRLGQVPRLPRPTPAFRNDPPAPESSAPSNRIAASRGLAELSVPPSIGAPLRDIEAPAWTGQDSPQPTRIEFAVNPAGIVVTARTTLSSGSREADAAALAAVRTTRFRPRTGRPGVGLLAPESMIWGLVTLHPVSAPAVPVQEPAAPAVVPAPSR
jgi:TonB family protein